MKLLPFADIKQSLVHPARTTLAAVLALLAAQLLGLPEVYWAPVTTMVVMQSTLGAALKISGQRLAGTALGSAAGALLVAGFGSNVLVYGIGVFGLGLLCTSVGLDRTAYRFAGITLTVIMLVARSEPAWLAGLHRFIEVSVGIIVGLIVTAIWPEAGAGPAEPAAQKAGG
jgi:uncharacterized membrane protein YccC